MLQQSEERDGGDAEGDRSRAPSGPSRQGGCSPLPGREGRSP